MGLGAVGAVDTAVAAIYVSLGSVSNFSALQVDPGAATDADGNLTFETLVNQGQLNLLAGDSLLVGTVAAAATGGTIDLKSGGSVHFTGAVAAGQTVLFRPPGGSVVLDHPEQFAGAITQFAATDLIDLPLGTASFQQYAGGVLSLNYGGGAVALQLATIYATPQFQFTGDGHGGTDILVSDAVCFCRGTLILTERGEVAVEDLAVGERVRTLSGAAKPIVWIGTGSAPVGRGNRLARPVIVRRGALAEGVPSRDLYLTHGHALYLDGVLIPVENLVNHRSILWDESAERVEYYHIELEEHDVLLANGAPAESYYDASNRAQFHNTRDGSRPGAAKPTFAPVLNGGDIVDRVWTRLCGRSGGCSETDTTDDPNVHVVVDGIRLDPQSIDGNCYTFALAAASGRLRLCSHTGVPSLLGITRHDHRRLGVAIEQIVLSQAGIAARFDFDAPQLREGGCYKHEDGFAWTDGDWALPARFFAGIRDAWTLEVHIRSNGMRYPIAIPLTGKMQRAA